MIAAAINHLITQIQAAGISNTYNHMPLMPTGALLKEQCEDGGILHLCTVTRPRGGRTEGEGQNYEEWDHTIQIELRRTYQDADSQAAHENEIDTILELFYGDDTLSGTAAHITSVRLAENRPYLFFNILVHYARIEVTLGLN